MDSDYDNKFQEMKKYIPFLERMIHRLENTSSPSGNPRQAQLDKIRSLRDLLLDKNKRMKMDNLLKCEQVLVNLYSKVEKGEPFTDINGAEEKNPIEFKEKSELEVVRNKLKTVAKIQDCPETLPEIARANNIELQYSGSKEPALFQRRPNKSSKSPTHLAEHLSSDGKKRNYTRILVSPNRSPGRWPSAERSSSDKPLFSRRTPPNPFSPPTVAKKDKKKTKGRSRKTKKVNITLNVPQERLNSFNKEDILPRIMNCEDGDIDIDTLREMRSQILGKLKETGNNDDISNFILQSYKKSKSNQKITTKNSKQDVEEGELSDSESEAIESIYGSLSVVDKEKKSLTEVKTIKNKDKQQPKIQICLYINDNKDATDDTSKQSPVIDLSEFEMFSENESDKSKDIISIDSDSSPSKKELSNKTGENIKSKDNMDVLPSEKKSSTPTETTAGDDDEEKKENKTIENFNADKNDRSLLDNNKTYSTTSEEISDTTAAEYLVQSSAKNLLEKPKLDVVEQPPKFIANFYKPIEEQKLFSSDTFLRNNDLRENINNVPGQVDSNNTVILTEIDNVSECTKDTAIATYVNKNNSENDISEIFKKSNIIKDTKSATSENKTDVRNITSTNTFEHNNESFAITTDKVGESQNIPLLNEPTLPPKAKTDVLSEIDILQALKNEILNETISVLGTEASTPALHQPKLTKVASSRGGMPKKRISIEKYKEKAATSTHSQLFVKKNSKACQEAISKKQSLKLTEKECERFNFPKRLSLDDDDTDVISDNDFLTEDKDDSFGLDDVYGDLAPKSPDLEVSNESSTPVIIPMEPVKAPVCVSTNLDVDMRSLLPEVSSTKCVQPPFVPSLGTAISHSPAYSVDRNLSEVHHIEASKTVVELSRISSMDPRIRRDTKSILNSPNPYEVGDPDKTPRSLCSNVISNAPHMTPSRAPTVLPAAAVYMHSMPRMTPNARTFEMTPTHQTFELDSSNQKHVYAPLFSTCDNRERESPVSKEGPQWDKNTGESRSCRWEESNFSIGGSMWEGPDPSNNSAQNDGSNTPRYEDPYVSKYEKFHNRRESSLYSRSDSPMTPITSFGWSECPATPSSAFGRQEPPMTPSHHFGRSDCLSTPVNSFGRADCPPTPSSGFGRNIDMSSNRSYVRSEHPSTPIHSFGRSECPSTPSHSFGRSECPSTPSHSFGRSESVSYGWSEASNSSKQIYSKDPRLNRRPTENELSSTERDRDYISRRGSEDSYKSQSRHCGSSNTSRNYDWEKSVGRSGRSYGGRNRYLYDRESRDETSGRSLSKEVENDPLYTRNRVSRYEERYSKNFDDFESRHNQKERSVSRFSNTKQKDDRPRSTCRAQSVGRGSREELNKDKISFQSDTGKNFTINTSVKSTFQEFLPSGKAMQVFEYSFDARRQRAASVGRSSAREGSVGRTMSFAPRKSTVSTYSKDINDRFKRACSVGKDTVNTDRTLKDVKADFEAFRAKLTLKEDQSKSSSKNYNTSNLGARSKKDFNSSSQDRKGKHNFYSRKNNLDPRMINDQQSTEIKTRYKIDRRNDSDRKRSGIVYSNDNIAKGTIMGSGFGVRNYRIPKIKRVEREPEISEGKETKESPSKDTKTSEAVENIETMKNIKNSDKKTKPKPSKEPVKKAEIEPVIKTKSKNQDENESFTSGINSEGRVTRSKKNLDTKESKADNESDVFTKIKKNKKAVIYDSDSDSGHEIEVASKGTTASVSLLQSPIKIKYPAVDEVLQIKPIDKAIDVTFEIDDMGTFSENLSDLRPENLSALISGLDDDIDATKYSNFSFTSKLENIVKSADNPEENRGKISEVIEKDLTQSNNTLQQNSSTKPETLEKTQQDNKPGVCHSTIEENSQNEVAKNVSVAITTIPETCQNEPNVSVSVNTVLSKINEDIVSTSEIDPIFEKSETMKDEKSLPDSTINKSVLGKTLPDSTNEIHCERSSDVTSTYDNVETSKMESDAQTATQKESFNSIGSLLSILQDKSKIKELLSMLGEQSNADNDKIKKKLEKLSEIVSDEEDENENQQGLDAQKEKDVNKTAEVTEITKDTEKTDRIEDKTGGATHLETLKIPTNEDKNVDVSPPTVCTENSVKYDLNVGENMGNNNPGNTSSTTKLNITHDKVFAAVFPSKTVDENLIHNNIDNENKTEENSSTYKMNNTISSDGREDKNNKLKSDSEKKNKIQETDDSNKMDYESNGEDNEPLVKKVTKKLKGKKTVNKLKLAPQKKKTTRAPVKTGVKKRGELQKLQEDIKEMFMSDNIFNATGIRMCRLAKMVSEKDSLDSGPVVVLEKAKGVQNLTNKIRKKPGPKPKSKVTGTKSKAIKEDIKTSKSKTLPKHNSGSKSKIEGRDPYDFDADSIADTNITKESDDDSSDTETGSLASSRSFGSNEVLADAKKKPKKKRRGIGGWQSGIIKIKNRKKKEPTQDNSKISSPVTKPQRPITIPDLNCFTDNSYCFQKGVTTYDCRLCVYSGSDIVNHYKQQHPHTEIPLSRMDPKTAELAIIQCEQKIFQAVRKISSDKYTCRFCYKEFANKRMVLESFFWHVVSNHTGEFKHQCPECENVTHCPFTLDIPPPPKDGGQLIGYICKKCNFTQISLENLKTHVLVHHSDLETEVFSINLAVVSNKAMKAMLRRAQLEEPRVLRSLRSNRSAGDISDIRDDRSDATESSGQDSDCESSREVTIGSEELEPETPEMKPKIDKIKSKLTFENDEPSDDSIKMELDEKDHDESLHLEDTHDKETADSSREDLHRGNSDEIVDYPHFKLNYADSGAKEYVCCINGNDSHYKTSLLISMKKHIQSKHSEKWDGYCCVCKVIVTLQGVKSDFRDCLSHFLDKHMDDFPVLKKVAKSSMNEGIDIVNPPGTNLQAYSASPLEPANIPPTLASALPNALTALSPAVPARVATPSVERTPSPSYIAVRPISQLLSREIDKINTPIALTKIGSVVSLGEITVTPAQPSPVYPTNAEPAAQPAKLFLYEDVQAEVMSKKHRVVLDAMMSEENLVRVYKCAGRFCSFTTDTVDDALLHATAHQRVGGEGALKCAYCNYDACDNGIDLVMHVFNDHSRCQFCCPMCFYRAAACQLVEVHYTKAHVGAMPLKSVLRSVASATAVGQSLPSTLLARDVAVQHFVCNHDEGACNFKTYTPRKFIEHLQQKHVDATSHPCNLCSTASPSAGELAVHLRSHGLKLYQCTWCVHGANTENELLAHVSAKHPDKQPQAYVRVITKGQDGGMRVLPLANLNKSTVPVKDVIFNAAKENPVKEAERSIDLEKLIGHTMKTIEAFTSESTADAAAEESIEISADNLPEVHDDSDGPTVLESLLTVVIPSEKSPEPILKPTKKYYALENENLSTVVKAEPVEVPSNSTIAHIICLDSDEEDAIVAKESQVTPTDDALKSSPNEDSKGVDTEVSRSSVTDDVSITMITEDVSKQSINKPIVTETRQNRQVQNVIDLSDDDPTPSNTTSDTTAATTEQDLVQDKASLYKCPWCYEICKSPNKLRSHVSGVCGSSQHSNMKCPYAPCTVIVLNVTKLIAHYIQVHTSNKFMNYCGVCKSAFPTLAGAKMHIRAAHKVMAYHVTTDIDENGKKKHTVSDAADQLLEPTRISGRKTSTEIQRYQAEQPTTRPRKTSTDIQKHQVEPSATKLRKTSTEMRKRYGIEDIDKLPISPILDIPVYCKLCEFGTKVKLNMVRHLLQHAEKLPVPRTAPINPVPHLESNEMHFDRMVNLASSSVKTRAPDKLRQDEPAVTVKIPASESGRYPKYVPERTRYTCGARECSYISVDMAMFRCHWETLHAREDEYRCVHCPPNQCLDTSIPLSAARILAHLRMHDVSLYACSMCSYYHYRKHCIEKHLSDIHKEGSIKIVREEHQSEPAAGPAVGAPTMDLKPWQCGLCVFSSMLRPNVVNHCGTEHQSKMQFKCAYCPFRTSTKENVVKHQTNAHPTKPEEVFYYFYREGSIPDETDGTCRWQVQRQKLGLDDKVLKTEPEATVTESLLPPTPVATPVTIDLNIVKEELLEEPSADTEMSIEILCKKFGEFCEPDGIKYKCCLCNVVKEHAREAMQCHLYEELNYRRWECVICSYKAFHKNGLNDHMASEHSRQFTPPRALPTDSNIEKWVEAVLDHQTKAIETNKTNLSEQKIQGERISLVSAAPKKPEPPKTTLSASDAELENAFGAFSAPKNQHYACPKCDFTTKDERAMVIHLESELSKIRWGCTLCEGKYTTFHEAQFHCKSAHTPPGRPKEAIRDPSLRSGWVKAVVATQKQFIKCISETNRESTPERDTEDCDQTENSLLVALYEEPVNIEQLSVPTKRPAPAADTDDDRLVIDEPPIKKLNDRKCPFCNYLANNTRYYREHILKQHYNTKPYKCYYCPFEGSRTGINNHLDSKHSDLRKRFITVEVPNTLPDEGATASKCDTVVEQVPKTTTRESTGEEVARKVCLYCEKSVPENEIESHSHGIEKAEFAKRGEIVVKCCKCLVLRLSVTSLHDHFDVCHPGEKVLDNYAFFKLQVDTREIHCCGHCYKKFKFLRDLKVHHLATHTSLSISYTSIPFSHNLHTEGDPEIGKRKLEEMAGPSTKRFARKSTSKLPNSAIAKKSTSKLPIIDQTQSDNEEYSYYGTKPSPLEHYKDVTVKMPMFSSVLQVDIEKLSSSLEINPKVVVKDYKN